MKKLKKCQLEPTMINIVSTTNNLISKSLSEEFQDFLFEAINNITEVKLRQYISKIESNILIKKSSTKEEQDCLQNAHKLLVKYFDNFKLNYQKGLITDPENEIDNYIDKWHETPNLEVVPLHEYLGFTWYEYSQWVSNPSNLLLILNAK